MIDIGILVNQDKDIGLKYTNILKDSIAKYGGQALLTTEICKALAIPDSGLDEKGVLEGSKVLISLGGDGTFLKAARKTYDIKLPILGVNLGNLGFLTEVDKNEIDHAIKSLVEGRYEIEERMMLKACVKRKGREIYGDIALNDVVISRGALSRILHLKTYINDIMADSYPGDGLIISSPTGSTAYSLSAGGPIVEPDTELIIITPICPHILYSRSIIITGRKVVRIAVEEDYSHAAMLTVDGQEGFEIRGGDVIEVGKAPNTVRLVRMGSRNFFNVLRTKIYDRGERFRKDEI